MTSRERILTAFAHKQPDKCPTFIWINNDAVQRVVEFMDVSSTKEAQEALGIDRWTGVGVGISRPDNYSQIIDSLVPDEYKSSEEFSVRGDGRVVRVHKGSDYLDDTVFNPLQNAKSKEDLDLYPFPQKDWIEVPDDLEDRIKSLKDNHYVVSTGIAQPFKSSWLLRGMDNVLMDYLINPELINEMYDRIYSFDTARCIPLVEAGVDMIKITGDLGMQDSLIMSPDTWREFDKWRLQKMIAKWKEINPELKIYMHTDGDVREIIEDLIEVGLDILNPIQPECMPPVEIKKKYGDKLVLHGAVSLQRTLPFGSPDDVKAEVKYLIENCNLNGGFVLGPSNVIFKEIPPENIVAMYKAVC